MVLDLADLRITQKILLSGLGPLASRLFNRKMFTQQVHSAHGNAGLSAADIEGLWQNILLQDGDKKQHLLIQYLQDRKRFEQTRWLPSLAMVQEPIHLCWGTADAVAKVAMPEYLQKNVCQHAKLTLMPDVGHFCQLSDPDVWLESVLSFY